MRISVASWTDRRGAHAIKDRPDPNSMRGRVYDRFMAYKGLSINITALAEEFEIGRNKTYIRVIIYHLNDEYDCDIRSLGRANWCLCGRYEGTKYIDYVTERHLADDLPVA